jgi:hypothetical protein
MGYVRHQGIIVTGCCYSDIKAEHNTFMARRKARELGLPCSPITKGRANCSTSFLIASDGSKEGWHTSNEQEEKRMQWIDWARKHGKGIDWVCVSFGGDDPQNAHLEDWNGRERAGRTLDDITIYST